MNKFLVKVPSDNIEKMFDIEVVYADEYIVSNDVLQFFRVNESKSNRITIKTVLETYASGFWKKVSLLEEGKCV